MMRCTVVCLGLWSLLAATFAACGGAAPRDASPESPAPISVLLVAGEPTWSYRYLHKAVLADPLLTVTTHVTSAARGSAQAKPRPGRPDLEALPATIEQLAAFDVVILCDWQPVHASDRWPLQLATFVERGGGLITMCNGGEARAYGDPLWQKVLPVLVAHQQARVPQPVGPTALRFVASRKPPSALRRALLDFAGPQSGEQLLPSLPGIYFAPSVFALAVPSEVLVTADAKAAPPNNAVIVARKLGEGHSLWVGTSELWRWRDAHAGRYFDAFASVLVRAVAGR